MITAVSPPPPLFGRFRLLTYLLVLLSVAGFSYAENNTFLFVLCLCAAVLSWTFVEARPASPGLPRSLINVGVFAVSVLLFRELVLELQPNLLLALGHFMTGILLCKLFERKNVRDYAQILTLTLLVMVAGAIFSASLTFAIMLIAYLIIGLYAILLLHLDAETRLATRDNRIAPWLDSGLSIRRDIRRVALVAGVFLVVIAGFVFLAIPRTRGQGLLTANWATDTTIRTGFSDKIRFSDYGQIQQSDAVVMEVKIEQDGMNSGSELYQPYFRGVALENYDADERQWSRATAPDDIVDRLIYPGESAQLIPPADYNTIGLVTEQFTMHSYAGSTLFTISTPVLFSPDHEVTINFNTRQLDLSFRSAYQQALRYSVTSAAIYKPEKVEPTFITPGDLGISNRSDGTPIRHNQVPAEVQRLAHSLLRDLLPGNQKPTVAQIRSIADLFEEYLRTTYPYSLKFEAQDTSLDPTADFLLNRKRIGGHCEYFASAMVMLCRSVGINARLVTGYHGGDFNSISGLYVVRQKYAHAWAEIYYPGRGWLLYDPSPVSSDDNSSYLITKWLRDVSEIIQKVWQSTIIAFDNSTRSYIFSVISNLVSFIAGDIHATVAYIGGGFEDLFASNTVSAYTRLACGVAVLLIAILAGWLLHHWHRRRTSQLPHILRKVDRKVQRQLAHELLFFDEFLRLLARTGSRKRPDQTPREYVEALAPALRGAAADARWLIGTFYDVRFGALRMTAPVRAQIALALRHVRDQLHAPAGERVRG